MNKKKLLVILTLVIVLLLIHNTNCFSQDPPGWDNEDPGGDLPIPGILYFLAALIGIGVKKLYHGRKKD